MTQLRKIHSKKLASWRSYMRWQNNKIRFANLQSAIKWLEENGITIEQTIKNYSDSVDANNMVAI